MGEDVTRRDVGSLLPDDDRQRHDDGKPGATFPLDLIDSDGQLRCGDHGCAGREGDLQGEPRETRPKAEVVTGAEREVMASGPADIEDVWVCDVAGITVRGRAAREHHGARSDRTSPNLGRRRRDAAHGTPGHESEALLRSRPRERRIGDEPLPLVAEPHHREHGVHDRTSQQIVTAEQQVHDRCAHLAQGEPALVRGAEEVRHQIVPRMPTPRRDEIVGECPEGGDAALGALDGLRSHREERMKDREGRVTQHRDVIDGCPEPDQRRRQGQGIRVFREEISVSAGPE